MMGPSCDEMEASMPESLAAMVSFLLQQLREARSECTRLRKLKEKSDNDNALTQRVNDNANKEIQRLTAEVMKLREKKTKRGK